MDFHLRNNVTLPVVSPYQTTNHVGYGVFEMVTSIPLITKIRLAFHPGQRPLGAGGHVPQHGVTSVPNGAVLFSLSLFLCGNIFGIVC